MRSIVQSILIRSLLLGLAAGYLAGLLFGSRWDRATFSAVGATLGFITGIVLDSIAFRPTLPRFSPHSILPATAFVSIWLVAVLSLESAFNAFMPHGHGFLLYPVEIRIGVLVFSPIWLPVGFVGYALGKRCLTLRMLLGLAVAEFLALVVVAVMPWYHGW